MKSLNLQTKKWIWNTWDKYRPEWFVTILWNDMPTSPITSSLHTSVLRNKLLCEVTGKKRCGDLPDFPNRLGLMTFQERTEMQNGKITFHTHMHIYNSSSASAIVADPHHKEMNSEDTVHYLIRYKVGSKIQKLLKSTTKGNEGVVVRKWEEDHHRYYNLKEMKNQKRKVLTHYLQDKDLLLDFENSDLLPLPDKNGHERISKAVDRSL